MTTPREQLARIIDNHRPFIGHRTYGCASCAEPYTDDTKPPADIPDTKEARLKKYATFHDWTYQQFAQHIADAIIQAGWTPPELPKPFDADCKTCGLERQEALENAGQGFWHIRPYQCPNCGNKRCPKAENHRHKCTGSNAPNQTPTLDN